MSSRINSGQDVTFNPNTLCEKCLSNPGVSWRGWTEEEPIVVLDKEELQEGARSEFQHCSDWSNIHSSSFSLFTSGFMSLHANSITGIKIVCPVHRQTQLPSSFSLLLTPYTTYGSQSWARGLRDKHSAVWAPAETWGSCAEECSSEKSWH